MGPEHLIIYGMAAICFFTSFIALYTFLRSGFTTENSSFMVLFPIFSAALIIPFFLPLTQQDFIFKPQIAEIIFFLAGGGLIYSLPVITRSSSAKYLLITALSLSAWFFIPDNFSLIENLSPVYSKLVIISGLFIFSSLSQHLNGIDGIFSSQAALISLGIFALSILGGVPLLLGGCGLTFFAIFSAFLIFNWYPAKLSFDSKSCNAASFILGWLLIKSTCEGSGPCILIFLMLFICEMITAIGKKMSLRKEFSDLTTNTYYYQTNLSGIFPSAITANLIRLQIVLLVLGCFELYAPNSYSIPIFSLIITFWYFNRLKNWETGNKSFRQLNQELIDNIKKNIDKINKD